MGGYGALLLGGRLGPQRVAAIAAESPALWSAPGDTAPGAFDDPADVRANEVFAAQAELTDIPVRSDCGEGDGFIFAARRYADSLTPKPAGGFTPGGHDEAYWRRMAPAQLRWIATYLA
jgi:enterochelin esterase-like enzyme